MEVDYHTSLDALDAELEAFIAAAAAAAAAAGGDVAKVLSIASAGILKDVVNCCGKTVEECQCTSTSSKEDEFIFTATTCSLEEFASTKRVMQLISYPNILSCLFMDITTVKVTNEFLSFIEFINKCPDYEKSQLAFLVLPVTVHFFALLLECEDVGVVGARNFLREAMYNLNCVKGYYEASFALRTFNDIKELKQNPDFAHYFESKTVVKMSMNVFQYLQIYLRHRKYAKGETLLLSLLSLNIDFESSDVGNNPNEDGESSDELKKTEIEGGEEKESNPEDLILKDMQISNVVIKFKETGQSYKFYNFDTEELVCIDNVYEYIDTINNPKIIDAEPEIIPEMPSHNTRNASNRLAAAKSKTKDLKVDPPPKKEEVKPKQSYKSIHSLDFNSFMTELAYVIGDTYIYTIKLTAPKKDEKKLMNMHFDFTVNLGTYEHDETCWKKTRDSKNEKLFAVKYLPEKPFYLLVASPSTVKLFQTDTCSFITEYVTDRSFIYSIDVDFMGHYFATANHDLAAYIYDFRCSVRLCILTGHKKAVTCVKFHPNGIYAATGSEDCTVRLFEAETGQCVRVFVDHAYGVWDLDFSYDGHLLASSDSSGLVNVWDIKDCTVISKQKVHTIGEKHCGVNSICFHESSFVLAACMDKGEVRFWDARNPENKQSIRTLKKPLKIKRHKNTCWSVAYTLNKHVD